MLKTRKFGIVASAEEVEKGGNVRKYTVQQLRDASQSLANYCNRSAAKELQVKILYISRYWRDTQNLCLHNIQTTTPVSQWYEITATSYYISDVPLSLIQILSNQVRFFWVLMVQPNIKGYLHLVVMWNAILFIEFTLEMELNGDTATKTIVARKNIWRTAGSSHYLW